MSVVATLQRQEGPPPKFLDVLDVEADDATHWPRGYGKAYDSHDEAFRSESRAVAQACLKMAYEWGRSPVCFLLGLGLGG